jgi:predicted cupin superfamily sugar epimerase
LFLKFSRVLVKCSERGIASAFHFADALFELLDGRLMGLRLFASLRIKLFIPGGRMLQLFLKFPRTLVKAVKIAIVPGFHFADALLELLYGRLMGLRLFASLRCQLFIPGGRMLQLFLKFPCALLKAVKIAIVPGFHFADALFELLDG